MSDGRRVGRKTRAGTIALAVALALLLGACNVTPATPTATLAMLPVSVLPAGRAQATPPATLPPGTPLPTPTPDPPHPLPTLVQTPQSYTVQQGDSLNDIARRFQVSSAELIQANDLVNPDLLYAGQVLVIPTPELSAPGTPFKTIPDSELVNGPAAASFDTLAFVSQQAGVLAGYGTQVDDQVLSGAQIVRRVSLEYSVNPRLLLALLDYKSGWVTQPSVSAERRLDPLGLESTQFDDLYKQLSWLANALNQGYYLWRANALAVWTLADGSLVPIAPTLNAGSAAVQYVFSLWDDRATWDHDVGPQGFYAAFSQMFGDPFGRAVEPLLPAGLAQPELQLPFEPGVSWSFTGGPHGAWGSGSAWGALDFAPPGDALGCVENNSWEVAAADGLIVRSENGAVVEDLDGDGHEETGWVLLYMHVATQDRIAAGQSVRAGQRIGHPSCEGGVSTGTHLHLARKYNGEWIPADGTLPFVLDGWVSSGAGREYDGWLARGDQKIEAWNGRRDENQIRR